jgi:hypothetical protein
MDIRCVSGVRVSTVVIRLEDAQVGVSSLPDYSHHFVFQLSCLLVALA